jgi:hypothetical protein
MEELDLSENEKFVINLLKEQESKTMSYKDMQDACEDTFEGLRLVLKALKEKGVVNFDGPMPGFSSEIKLNDLTFI